MEQATLGVILQARMASQRLPGKALLDLAGIPLIGHALARAERAQLSATFAVATTENAEDDAIEAFCRSLGVTCYRGSEQDVMLRFYLCAKIYGFEQILRLTGDNPFIFEDGLQALVSAFQGRNYDYANNLAGLPKGCGAEIFTLEALEASIQQTTQPDHREHVTLHFRQQPETYKILLLENQNSAVQKPEVNLSIDTFDDLDRARFLLQQAGEPLPTLEKLLQFTNDHP